MEAFLRYLVTNLLGPSIFDTGEAELTCTVSAQRTAFQLRLPEREIGKMIGKQGRTVEAIRGMLNAAGARSGQRVLFQIIED